MLPIFDVNDKLSPPVQKPEMSISDALLATELKDVYLERSSASRLCVPAP